MTTLQATGMSIVDRIFRDFKFINQAVYMTGYATAAAYSDKDQTFVEELIASAKGQIRLKRGLEHAFTKTKDGNLPGMLGKPLPGLQGRRARNS